MNNAARALGAAVLLGFASSALARHHGTAAAAAAAASATTATVPDPTTTADIRYDDQLSGTWKNELGSVLRLRARGGLLSGTYESAVGNATGAYNLTGAYVSPRSDDGGGDDGGGATAPLPLSFVVHFRNEMRDARSVTAWTGHAIGDQRLDMLWTLASEPATADALWASTRVNKNTFAKQK